MLTTSRGLTVDQLNSLVCRAKANALELRSILQELEAECDVTDVGYGDEINERQILTALQDLQWLELSLSCLNFGLLTG